MSRAPRGSRLAARRLIRSGCAENARRRRFLRMNAFGSRFGQHVHGGVELQRLLQEDAGTLGAGGDQAADEHGGIARARVAADTMTGRFASASAWSGLPRGGTHLRAARHGNRTNRSAGEPPRHRAQPPRGPGRFPAARPPPDHLLRPASPHRHEGDAAARPHRGRAGQPAAERVHPQKARRHKSAHRPDQPPGRQPRPARRPAHLSRRRQLDPATLAPRDRQAAPPPPRRPGRTCRRDAQRPPAAPGRGVRGDRCLPGRGCDLVAHAGLDRLVSVRDVWQSLSGDLLVQAHWWRVLAADVPRDADDETRLRWLYDWWQRVDAWITAQDPSQQALSRSDPEIHHPERSP